MKRDCAMVLRLTQKELDRVTAKAHKAGMSREGYVRTVLNNSRIIPAPEVNYYPLIRGMRSVGRSIDQILAKANSIGFLDVLALRKSLENVHTVSIRIMKTFTVKYRLQSLKAQKAPRRRNCHIFLGKFSLQCDVIS